MRAMVLGAGGMLGYDLATAAPADIAVVPLTHAELDILDAAALERTVHDIRPDVIVNAAAYTAVDQAESEKGLAFRVNGEAVGVLGRIAAGIGARVVHFSTDYVFDGTATEPYTEDAATNPLNVYGASKLAGEEALRQSGAEFLLIRTQWLFGLQGRSFPRTMWERAKHGLPTQVVNDQVGSPTYTRDLATSTWRLLHRGSDGKLRNQLVHVANSGNATWYEVARQIFGSAGVPELLTPCQSEQYPLLARRPPWTVLDTTSYQTLTGSPPPHWKDALRRFLGELRLALM